MFRNGALAIAALVVSLGCVSRAAPQNEAVDLRVKLSPETVPPASHILRLRAERTTHNYKVTVQITNNASEAIRLKKLSVRQTEAAQVVLPVIKRSYDLPVPAGSTEQVEIRAVGHFDNTSPGRRLIGPIQVRAEFSSVSGRVERSQTIQVR